MDFLNKNCCQSGCTDCPYDYHLKADPNIPAELSVMLNESNEFNEDLEFD